MHLYNIEFFDLSLNCVYHEAVSSLLLDYDCLTPESSTISLNKNSSVSTYNLVYVREFPDFLGIVSDVSAGDNTTEVSVKPFISIFEHTVRVNTMDSAWGVALETTIKNLITQYWIDTRDDDKTQEIPTMTVRTTSSTMSWDLGLKPANDNVLHCTTEFYSSIISKAMSKYGIHTSARIDFNAKKIVIEIGTVTTEPFYIDTTLKSLVLETFSIDEISSNTNKLEVWNSENFSDYRYYYFHPNSTGEKKYDMDKNTDRKFPVRMEVQTAAPSGNPGEEGYKSFAEAADDAANNTFSGIEWKNLIEFTCSQTDKLVKPLEIKMGQTVYVVKDGTAYASILTGKKLSEDITLSFGTVRKDLTKKLKLGGR